MIAIGALTVMFCEEKGTERIRQDNSVFSRRNANYSTLLLRRTFYENYYYYFMMMMIYHAVIQRSRRDGVGHNFREEDLVLGDVDRLGRLIPFEVDGRRRRERHVEILRH